jgi:malate/lactate dehydrogenase
VLIAVRSATNKYYVGVGDADFAFTHALVLDSPVGELVLIDANRERAGGEAMDLNHAVPLSKTYAPTLSTSTALARFWCGAWPT